QVLLQPLRRGAWHPADEELLELVAIRTGDWRGHGETSRRRGVVRLYLRSMRDASATLQEMERSIEQPVELLAQPAEDPALGDVDGAQADAQLSGDLGGRLAAGDVVPVGPPGGRGELRLHELLDPAQQVGAVLGLAHFQGG